MKVVFRPLNKKEVKQAFRIVETVYLTHYEEDYYVNRQKDGQLFGFFISGKLGVIACLNPKRDGVIFGMDDLARNPELKDKEIRGQTLGRYAVKSACKYLLKKYKRVRFLELFAQDGLKEYYEGLGFRTIPNAGPKTIHPLIKQLR
jgi:hypothetical protein